MTPGKLRIAADKALDRAGQQAEKHPRLASWRSDRFYAQARERLPVIMADGAHGTRYLVRPGDVFIGAEIIRTGGFERAKIALALSLLRAAGIEITQLLDIGANIGTTTVEILRQMPRVTGVAFEPEPGNFRLLRMNLIATDLDQRVRPHQLALSNATDQVQLELASDNFGDNRVRLAEPLGRNAFAEQSRTTISVPAARLDDLDGLQVTESTLLFIDVQGLEGHVLAGAGRVLEARPPIVLELWPYALDRAGGRGMVFDCLSNYSRICDINASPPQVLAPRELAGYAQILTARDALAQTDLLALA